MQTLRWARLQAALGIIDVVLTLIALLIALIHPENSASRRVAEKTGLTLRKLIQHRVGTRCLYAIEHGEQT